MARHLVYQYRFGRSPLHRLDPLTKLIGMFAISFLAFGVYIGWVQLVLTITIVVIAIGLAWISLSDILRGTWPFVIACTSFFIIQSATLPGRNVAYVFFNHPFYAESIDYALASALRIYAILLVSLVFIRTTDPRALAVAMVVQCRVPYRIAYAFFIALRIIPVIEEETKNIRAAHLVRGVDKQRSLLGKLKETQRYTMPLLVGSMRRASTMVLSMEARAFGAYPTRTFVEVHPMGTVGKVISITLILLVIIWYTLLGLGIVHSVYIRSGS